MSTIGRRSFTAFVTLAAAGVALDLPVDATPPFVAAARQLPPAAQRQLLGGTLYADALTLEPDGRVSFGTVDLAALESGSRGDEHGRLSVGTRLLPLLNRSTQLMGAITARNDFHLTGAGVAIAVVDTGLDVRHADFRNADGTTRVAWLLDYSRPVRGIHPEIESRFGFVRDDGTTYGAVYSAADLDALLANERTSGLRNGQIPEDEVGHGTHVASIAAGNGLATGNGQPAGRYIGVAPGAELIIVRASAAGAAAFSDAAVVAGATFAADRATAMGVPVVINLSLGSQAGTHDGNSPLERGLAALVPPGTPGRAIVVAAGNQGGDPGVHTRADVFERVTNELPLRVAHGTTGDVLLVDVAYEGQADIALAFPNGDTTPWIFAGQARGYANGDALVSIANATDGYVDVPNQPALMPGAQVRAATVLITADEQTHTDRSAGTYKILVRGHGIVHAYIGEDYGADGAPAGQFVGDLDYGSVSVPATSPELVSVGASVSRINWTTADREIPRLLHPPVLGAVAEFSARGPNRVNEPRPDLLAPGQFIVAALSTEALPGSPLSIFPAGDGTCMHSCYVAEDGVHAVAAGTSSAAPHVAGAMALLLQLHPTATQDALRAVLADTALGATGGNPRWNNTEGWGSIQVDAAAARWMGEAGPMGLSAGRSEVTVTLDRVAPEEPATVTVRLTDATGATLSGEHEVTVHASHGVVLETSALGEGRYAARWRASGMAPGDRALFTVTVDGTTLVAQPGIAVARNVLSGDSSGGVSGGGCSARGSGAGGWATAGVLLAMATAVGERRRRRTG